MATLGVAGLVAMLVVGGLRDAGELASPDAPVQAAMQQGGASAAARPPASAGVEAQAGRLALDAADKALRVLAAGGENALTRRQALSLALDPAASLRQRIRALRLLGSLGDPEALDVIERLLAGETSAALLSEAAAGLGRAPRGPVTDSLLERLLAGPAGPARAGAIRALGSRGGEAEQRHLLQILLDANEDPAARSAAADALAGLGGPEVAEALARVVREGDEALVAHALESLAAHPARDAEGLLRGMLADPQLAGERRVAILESLSASSPAALPLLLEYAAGGATAEARAAAVESLSLLDDAPGVGRALLGLVATERDPAVRAELYHALSLHADWGTSPPGFLDRAMAETERGTRLHGAHMLASRLRRRPEEPALAGRFDRELLPWLTGLAEDPGASRYDRVMAVDALKLGGTERARDVLADLAHGRDPLLGPVAQDALEFPALP